MCSICNILSICLIFGAAVVVGILLYYVGLLVREDYLKEKYNRLARKKNQKDI